MSKKKVTDTESFIRESSIIHNNRYDYSKVNYINSGIKVNIICSKHGVFEQLPRAHLKGNNCHACSILEVNKNKCISTETFIERAKKIHGDKYDYTKTVYINGKTDVEIFCNYHKNYFLQEARVHLMGCGCRECASDILSQSIKINNTDAYIKKAKTIHGDKYNYSETKYVSSIDDIKIICSTHGAFIIKAKDHIGINKIECPKCMKNAKTNKIIQDNLDLIKLANEKYNYKYDYSKVDLTKLNEKIIFICSIHGEKSQNFNKHVYYSQGCYDCYNIEMNLKYKNEFIENSIKAHNDTYDYSKVNYINQYEKVIIICKIHGDFEQAPIVHELGCGCQVCDKEKRYMTKEKWLARSIGVHGEIYDYSDVNYIDQNEYVKIKCYKHGEFAVHPTTHSYFKSAGCKKCISQENFLKEAKSWYGDKFDYSKFEYTAYNKKSIIRCKEHNLEFSQSPRRHYIYSGCEKCNKTQNRSSKIEVKWLDSINMPEENRQYKIIIGDKKFYADAYDPATNTVYEFNGDFWHGNPRVFDPDDTNYSNGKTFGYLYDKTIEKENILKAAGYNIITMWENDYLSQKNSI